MFKRFRFWLKKKHKHEENVVAEKENPLTSQQRAPDTPAAATASAAPAQTPKAGKPKKGWKKLFICFKKSDIGTVSSTESNEALSVTSRPKKKSRGALKFDRSNKVSPLLITNNKNKNHGLNRTPPEKERCTRPPTPPNPENHRTTRKKKTDMPKQVLHDPFSSTSEVQGTSGMKAQQDHEEQLSDLERKFYALQLLLLHTFEVQALKIQDDKCTERTKRKTIPLGFPNIGNSCYMNSCLQSILGLEDFIRDINCQRAVWRSVPEAGLLRKLIAIMDCYNSTNYVTKLSCLLSFKKVFSVHAPDFQDNLQKDAHEFLTLLLEQIHDLSPMLQIKAAALGKTYTCPVKEHVAFKMENIRTCKRCGAKSEHKEEFTSLSVNLIPDGSVTDMIQTYLKEGELEYRCECGGRTSGLRVVFDTLPKVLILHLKRFCVTATFHQQKLNDPVSLQRDIVVPFKQGNRSYSLVSVISHYGNITEGHYICDGLQPEDNPDEPTNLWLTFDDESVYKTTLPSVFKLRKKSAFILVYRRQDSGQDLRTVP